MKPLGEPRRIAGAEIQYLEGLSDHGHEGGHRVAIAGRELLVLPDGHTTARKRSQAISTALQKAEEEVVSLETALIMVIGSLVKAGAYAMTLDGEPIGVPTMEDVVASFRVDVVSGEDGAQVRVVSMGGGST